MKITVQKDTHPYTKPGWVWGEKFYVVKLSFDIEVKDIETVEDIQEVIRQCKLIEEELSDRKCGSSIQFDKSVDPGENIQDK